MRAAIVAFMFAATCAHAEDLAYARNKAGGAIVLTNFRGDCPSNLLRYDTTDAQGSRSQMGCYTVKSPWILAVDNDGNSHNWLLDDFTLTDFVTKRKPSM